MKPVLYSKTETTFTTLGLGEIDAIYTEVTREANGLYTLYMEYPRNGRLADVFEKEMQIKADAGRRTKWQTFDIDRVVKNDSNIIKVYGKHIKERAETMGLNPEINVRDADGNQVLNIWKNNLVGDTTFDTWSDISTKASTTWTIDKVSNAHEALMGVRGSILDVWGGEYVFDNNLIRLYREAGRKAPTILEYGRNITAIEQDELLDGVYTSIYPYAVYTKENSDGSPGKDVIVTLDELIVDGPHVESYSKRRIQVVDLSGEYDEDDIPTQSDLRAKAQAYVERNDVGAPRISQEVEYIDLSRTLDYEDYQIMEEVELYDRVPVFYPKLNIHSENVKVNKIVYDVEKEENKSIVVGFIGQSFRNSVVGGINEQLEKLANTQSRFENSTVPYLINAAGNRIWYTTPDDSIEHKIGDVWFEENGQYTRIRVWNGNQWIVEIDNEDVAKNAAAIADAQQDIQSAQSTADEAVNRINTEITQKFTSLDDNLLAIQSISTRADANALAAIDNASTAMSNALTALDNISGLESTVQNINVDIDQINGTLDLKADRQTVDALSGIVENHTIDIQANADGLALKADSSVVDTLTGDVSTLSAQVGLIDGELSSKISQTQLQSAIDGIEVGGRNLLKGTSDSWTTLVRPEWGWFYQAGTDYQVEVGETYTFSIIVEKISDDTVPINLHFGLGSAPGSYVWDFPRWRRNSIPFGEKISLTYTVIESDVNGGARTYFAWRLRNERLATTIRFKEVKLEKGNKATDWTPAPEDIMQLISNVETEWRQTAQGFEQSITRIQSDVNGKAGLVAFNTLESKVDGTVQRIGDAEGNITQIEANVNGLQTTVASKADSSTVTQLANVVDTKVSNDDYQAQMSTMANNINARVAKGEVMSQINIEAGRTLIDTDRLYLSANTTVFGGSAFIPNAAIESLSADKLTAGEINAAEINVIGLNTSHISGLDANFIRARFNEVSTTLGIDGSGLTINRNDGTTNSKLGADGIEFWINGTKHGMLGARSYTGTESYLVGRRSVSLFAKNNSYVSLSYEGSSGTSPEGEGHIALSILGSSGNIRAHNRMYFGRDSNAQINPTVDGNLNISGESAVAFGYRRYEEFTRIMDVRAGGMRMYGQINMNTNNMSGLGFVEFTGSGNNRIEADTASSLAVTALDYVTLGIRRSGVTTPIMDVRAGGMRMYANINLNGYNTTNPSDERLKSNIVDDEIDSLAAIKNWRLAGFDWIDENKNQERQFGVIAQSAPEISSVGEDGYLSVNASKQLSMVTHAIQQLAEQHENTLLVASHAYLLAEQHEDEITCLKREVKELKEEIEELRGMCA